MLLFPVGKTPFLPPKCEGSNRRLLKLQPAMVKEPAGHGADRGCSSSLCTVGKKHQAGRCSLPRVFLRGKPARFRLSKWKWAQHPPAPPTSMYSHCIGPSTLLLWFPLNEARSKGSVVENHLLLTFHLLRTELLSSSLNSGQGPSWATYPRQQTEVMPQGGSSHAAATTTPLTLAQPCHEAAILSQPSRLDRDIVSPTISLGFTWHHPAVECNPKINGQNLSRFKHCRNSTSIKYNKPDAQGVSMTNFSYRVLFIRAMIKELQTHVVL